MLSSPLSAAAFAGADADNDDDIDEDKGSKLIIIVTIVDAIISSFDFKMTTAADVY